MLLDGQDVNLEQIKAELAWHYKQYDKGQRLADQGLYAKAEEPLGARRLGYGAIQRLLRRGISGGETCAIS